ncbi:MAG: InlB B-repeat-containing protein [Bacteroides sp.]|nr:InlB B-repeat-containing protein [Bacillota bacterium]MCM1394257.1 InlB B-repeat-containing protein [[Eubacterium] siraeum]MCM1455756.1 InlB B-repeat-containing protein [Bacteroides sp.]
MKKISIVILAVVLIIGCLCFTACNNNAESFDVILSQSVENGEVYALKTRASEGEKVILSCKPNAGYKLARYAINGEYIEGSSFIMPKGDVEVSAEFELLTYSIVYELNGGEVEEGNPATYTVEDGEISLIQPTKTGFEFGGWYTYFADIEWYLDSLEDFKMEKISSDTTGKITLYAHYYNLPYAIEVEYAEHGDVYCSVYEAYMGEEVTVEYSVYDNYELEHFLINGEPVEGNTFIMPNRDVTVTAVIKPIEYNITYVLDGASNSSENPATYNCETADFDLAPAEKEGFEFYSWYYIADDGEKVNVYNISNEIYPYRDLTLYADWYE